MDHHLIKECDLRERCPYCSEKLNDKEWDSELTWETHYKATVCECGKKVWVSVDFCGDGNDSWDGRDATSRIKGAADGIDAKVKAVEKMKMVQ